MIEHLPAGKPTARRRNAAQHLNTTGMQQIDFHFNVAQRTIYACRLIKKVRGMGLTVAVWSSDEVILKRAYDDLWRFEDLTFIAHAWAGSPFEADAPVVFASDITKLKPADVIILLDEMVPPDWQNALAPFKRVVDIVSTNQTELMNSRARYKLYKTAGVTLNAYDRSAG